MLSKKAQLSFYLLYAWRKLFFNLLEVKKPVGKLYLANLFHFLSKFYAKLDWKRFAGLKLVVTIFGTFSVRPHTFDVICAAPDFERPDVDFTLKIISQALTAKRRIIYLDVGANFGLYSIIVGNAFKADQNIKIYGFEPVKESYQLFVKNVEHNSLADKVMPLNFGLGEKNGEGDLLLGEEGEGSDSLSAKLIGGPNTVRILLKQLDGLGLAKNNADILFIKLDVEKAEKRVLEGGRRTLGEFGEIYLMVEDSMDVSIRGYLQGYHFKEIARMTPYNSFWYLTNEKN